MPQRTFFHTKSFFWSCAFALSHIHVASAFEQCYYPDGLIATDYDWEPCTGAQYSSCCIPSEGDICQENGLCYYPDEELDYRGTCTDPTWTDPSCPQICVNGYKDIWTWALECDKASGSSSYVCGPIENGSPQTPTCPANAAANTADFQTTVSLTSYGRYTPTPSINTALYSLVTSSYTTVITANARTTTITSTFASTFTSTLRANAEATSTSTPGGAANINGTTKNGLTVTLTSGALIGVVVGPLVALAIGLGVFFYLRKRRAKREQAIRLNSATGQGPYPPVPPPPPNGPVGADQVYPYEVDNTESPGAYQNKYTYHAPKVDTYEIDDRTAAVRAEKRWNNGDGLQDSQSPISPMKSPAPAYQEAFIPVELDAAPIEMDATPRGGGRR